MQRIAITKEGYTRLSKELKRLREVERHDVIKAIAEAREHGDLSENAEYHAAREKQSFIEGKIAEIETAISRADIIDPAQFKGLDSIKFSATVVLLDNTTKKESTYQIVSEHESDIEVGRIAVKSPLARAMMGKLADDTIEVKSPNGTHGYTIVKVNYS